MRAATAPLKFCSASSELRALSFVFFSLSIERASSYAARALVTESAERLARTGVDVSHTGEIPDRTINDRETTTSRFPLFFIVIFHPSVLCRTKTKMKKSVVLTRKEGTASEHLRGTASETADKMPLMLPVAGAHHTPNRKLKQWQFHTPN